MERTDARDGASFCFSMNGGGIDRVPGRVPRHIFKFLWVGVACHCSNTYCPGGKISAPAFREKSGVHDSPAPIINIFVSFELGLFFQMICWNGKKSLNQVYFAKEGLATARRHFFAYLIFSARNVSMI